MSECHDNSTQRQPKLPGSQPSVVHPDPCHLGLCAQIRAEWTDPGIQGKFSAWWSFCLLGWGVLLANRILDSQVAAERADPEMYGGFSASPLLLGWGGGFIQISPPFRSDLAAF